MAGGCFSSREMTSNIYHEKDIGKHENFFLIVYMSTLTVIDCMPSGYSSSLDSLKRISLQTVPLKYRSIAAVALLLVNFFYLDREDMLEMPVYWSTSICKLVMHCCLCNHESSPLILELCSGLCFHTQIRLRNELIQVLF